MKKVSEIMEELGFRPEASFEVKKAFIKNLIKQANEEEWNRMKIADAKDKQKQDPDSYQQISLFDQKKAS